LTVLFFGCEVGEGPGPSYLKTFIKYYGLGGDQTDEYGTDLALVSDGFVLLGKTVSNTDLESIYVVKANGLGNEVWNKKFGGAYNCEPASINITPEGNFIIGATATDTLGNKDMMLLLIGPDGTLVDSVMYGEPNLDETVGEVITDENGGYVLIGTTINKEANIEETIVLRTYPMSLDTLPQADWRRVHSEGKKSQGKSIVQAEGRFYCLGSSNSNNGKNGSMDLMNYQFFPLDNYGEQINNTYWGTLEDDLASQVINTDGGFVVLGNTVGSYIGEVPESSNIYLLKLSTQLVELSRLTITSNADSDQDKPVFGKSVLDIGSGYVILGYKVDQADNKNIYLVNVNKAGEVVFERTYGSSNPVLHEGGNGLAQLEDGHFVFVATVDMGSQSKMALFKTDPNGDLY